MPYDICIFASRKRGAHYSDVTYDVACRASKIRQVEDGDLGWDGPNNRLNG
jgi:hypothetical protein